MCFDITMGQKVAFQLAPGGPLGATDGAVSSLSCFSAPLQAEEWVEEILAIVFVLGIPSLALATHVVVRPLIREYAKLKGIRAEKEEIEGRMAQLEDVVHDLDRQVNRLIEAERFRRELESGGRDRRSLPDV